LAKRTELKHQGKEKVQKGLCTRMRFYEPLNLGKGRPKEREPGDQISRVSVRESRERATEKRKGAGKGLGFERSLGLNGPKTSLRENSGGGGL